MFRWVEFTDEEKNKDFFKNMSLEPITDKDIAVKEKDLGDDECEVEMRTNLVVTILMSLSYCYLHLFHFTESLKCLDYALSLAPTAADVLFRRAQVLSLNRLASC